MKNDSLIWHSKHRIIIKYFNSLERREKYKPKHHRPKAVAVRAISNKKKLEIDRTYLKRNSLIKMAIVHILRPQIPHILDTYENVESQLIVFRNLRAR